jgi:hypothetical protein
MLNIVGFLTKALPLEVLARSFAAARRRPRRWFTFSRALD